MVVDELLNILVAMVIVTTGNAPNTVIAWLIAKHTGCYSNGFHSNIPQHLV